MPTVEKCVNVTISLPRDLVERVSRRASETHRSVEEEIGHLIAQSIFNQENVDKALQKARADYDAELAATGRARPTTEELWEQMRRIREEVANELYPD